MKSFNSVSARSYIGRNVNLHLKDGAVIVNVHLTRIHKASGRNNNQVEYSLRNRKSCRIPLKSIAFVENVNSNFIEVSA